MIKLRRKKQRFFTTKEEETIILAIRHAERQTSGEIRVHIQHKLEKEVLVEATMAFHRLKMDRTEERNGVIFFLCPSQKQFAIFGDEGINKKVSDGFWDDVKEILETSFRQRNFVEGLVNGIELAGEKLKYFFPIQSNDQNELPDEISYE